MSCDNKTSNSLRSKRLRLVSEPKKKDGGTGFSVLTARGQQIKRGAREGRKRLHPNLFLHFIADASLKIYKNARNPTSFHELSSRKIVFREFREMQTRDINVDPSFKRRKQREKNPWYPLLAFTVTSYLMYEYFMSTTTAWH